MLALKPNCQSCDTDIPYDNAAAFICTFECTYCAPCTLDKLKSICPACGGNLTPRPVRPADKLAKYPGQVARAQVN